MASADGGMDIEEVAAKTPEKILKELHRSRRRPACRSRRGKLGFALGLDGDAGRARSSS